jgi:hypothetical protein
VFVGYEQKIHIDIDKDDVKKIAEILDRELVDDFHFAQLRIDLAGMEDEDPILSVIVHIYGEDENGKSIDVDFPLYLKAWT